MRATLSNKSVLLSLIITTLGCTGPVENRLEPRAGAESPLVIRGAPEIPRDLVLEMAHYLDARPISLQDLSDDGASILLTSRYEETSQLFFLDATMTQPKQLTFEPEPVRNAQFVPGFNTQATYMADVGGNEQYQVYKLDLTTGEKTLLSDGTSRHGSYMWFPSGTRILLTNNARNGRDFDLYVSKADGGLERVLETQGYWYPLDISPDGESALVGQYVSAQLSRIYLFNLVTKALTPLTPQTDPGANRQARFGPDGRRLFITSDRGREHMSLYEVDTKSGDWTLLSGELPWSVEQISLSRQTRTLAFTTNEGGYSKLYRLDLENQAIVPLPAPKGVVSSLQIARNAPHAAFTLRSPAHIGSIYSVHLKTGVQTERAQGDLGELDASALSSPRLIHYPTFDDRSIPGFYYRPQGEGPFPTIIKIHGGPESQSRPTFNTLIQYLVNECGYAVITPNVRGSRGYGKSYLALDNGMKRKDSVRDIGSLLDWVRHQPELDSTRVGVIGGSYGGYMVLASLLDYGPRIRAGVDVVGISNFVTFLENTKAYRRDLRRQEYGDERIPEMRAFLERISPTTNIAHLESALMVAHGANDPRVPLSETDQIVESATKLGKPVWYMVAHNEGHGFRKRENRDTYLMLSVLFFQRHLN